MPYRKPKTGRVYRGDEMCPLDPYASGLYAALEAVGMNHVGSALNIVDALREKFVYLMNHPTTGAYSSGGIDLRRVYDGDEELGIEVVVSLGTVYASEIEAWKKQQT